MTPEAIDPPLGPRDPVAAAALTAFGLPGARVVAAFEASTRNDNLLVETPDGDRLVLRRCRRNSRLERIRWQARFQRRLLAAGFPVPEPLATSSGDDVVEVGGMPWLLQRFVDGEHYDFDRFEHAEEAGRRLAEFHLLTAGVPADGSRHPLETRARRWWSEPDAELARLRARFAGDGIDDDLDAFESWLRALHEEWPLARFDALPAGWAHGDYHGRNLLYQGDRIVALLDFDMIEAAPFILDLTRAAIAFGRERRGSTVVRVEVARRLLAAYETVRPLERDERAAIAELAPVWAAPLDNFYEWHPLDRHQPLAAVRQHLDEWRGVLERRGVLEEVVA